MIPQMNSVIPLSLVFCRDMSRLWLYIISSKYSVCQCDKLLGTSSELSEHRCIAQAESQMRGVADRIRPGQSVKPDTSSHRVRS
jgi:hypothetical protein